jgi:GNAT superfamily N-acetyltransferase
MAQHTYQNRLGAPEEAPRAPVAPSAATTLRSLDNACPWNRSTGSSRGCPPLPIFSAEEGVGWRTGDPDAYRRGLDDSSYSICAQLGDELVGMARVVGDCSTCFYIQDVMVRPEHQGNGIGQALMESVMSYIAASACVGAVVGLMVAKRREPFYEQFGFWSRPNEDYGAA